MATRFYLSSTAPVAGGITPGFAAWTRTTEGDRREMSVAKDRSALTNKSLWANGTAAANDTALCRQYISAPMAGGIGFVTTDTFKCVIRAMESAANDNINRSPICLKVYAADGTTLQATLFALAHAGPNTTEWNTSLRNKQFADGDVLATNYTTTAGDRLVLEVGGQVDATGGTSVTGNLNFGSSSASDNAENETGTAANNPWLELSRNITFLAPEDDDSGWDGVQRASQIAASLLAATFLTAQVALAAGAGWIPEEFVPAPQGPTNITPASQPAPYRAESPWAPAPWRWHVEELPFGPPPIGVDEGVYQPPVVPPTLPPSLGPAWHQDEIGSLAALAGDGSTGFAPRLRLGAGPRLAIHSPGDGQGHLSATALPGDEGEYQPPLPAPSLFAGLAPVPDEFPVTLDEAGYQPPPPPPAPALGVVFYAQDSIEVLWVAEDFYVPALPLPVPISVLPVWFYQPDEYPTPPVAAPWEDSGYAPVVFVGPTARVQMPQGGGMGGPPPSQPFGLVDGDGDEAVRLLGVRPPAPDVVLLLDGTEDYTPVLDEDGYQPLVLQPGQPVRFDPWRYAVDERVGSQPTIAGDEGTYALPPALAVLPALWAPWQYQQDEYPTPVVSALWEDMGYAPRVRVGAGYRLAIHTPGGGQGQVATAVVGDEGVYPTPMPPLWVVPAYVPGDQSERNLPFGLDDMAGPPFGWRVLAPQWQPWVYWEADQSWPTPPAPLPGRGRGRTHLFLGQIDTAAVPAGPSAELYVLTGAYGQATGDDQPLLVETPNLAPMGPQGRLRLRRLVVPFQYDAACTLRVTPIVDYHTELDPLVVSHPAPDRVTRHLIQMKVMQACTVVRLRVEVLDRDGRVDLYTPSLYFDPLSGGTPMALGGQP